VKIKSSVAFIHDPKLWWRLRRDRKYSSLLLAHVHACVSKRNLKGATLQRQLCGDAPHFVLGRLSVFTFQTRLARNATAVVRLSDSAVESVNRIDYRSKIEVRTLYVE